MKKLKQKEPPSAIAILNHSSRTKMSVQSVSLLDWTICVVHVKIDFLNIRIAVHYWNNSLHELKNTVIYVKDLFDSGCAAAQPKNELKIRFSA